MNVVEFLSGKKTYVVAVCVGLVAVAQYLNVITAEVAGILYGLLGATGLATTRVAIEKSGI